MDRQYDTELKRILADLLAKLDKRIVGEATQIRMSHTVKQKLYYKGRKRAYEISKSDVIEVLYKLGLEEL